MKKKQIISIQKTVLPEKEPKVIDISGNIDSVTNWLEKRVIAIPDHEEAEVITTIPKDISGNLIIQKEAHVIIDRDKMSIVLVLNEMDPFFKGKVSGALTPHPDFEKWMINTGEDWNHDVLAEFIKMNRTCFSDKVTAMKLVTELKTLKVKVDKEVENSNDNRGNFKALLVQKVVEASIPDKFKLITPVYKGQKKVEFEVEIYVNPSTFRVTLISPDANDIISEIRDTIIDKQKKKITELAPDIVIIEQ